MSDLDRGDSFRTVVVWALDRSDRRGAATVAALLDKHSETGRRIVGVDGTDTSDPQRRMEMINRAEFAREYSESLSKNVTRTKTRRRAEGRWLGGTPPFGLQVVDGKLAPLPDTFPAARELAERALAGETVFAVVSDFNDRGLAAAKGGPWTVGAASALLRNPAFAGLQTIRQRAKDGRWPQHADVFLDEDGRPVSTGEGVITPDERHALLRVLDERAVAVRQDGGGRRTGRRGPTTLLAGDLLRCPGCGGRSTIYGTGGYRYYRCAATANRPGACEGFSAPIAALDEYVTDRFIRKVAALQPGAAMLQVIAERWRLHTMPDAVEANSTAREALADARDAVDRAARLVVSGVLMEEEAARQMPRLRAAVQRAEERLRAAELPTVDVVPLLGSETMWGYWDGRSLAEQRATLALGIDEVLVVKAGRRGVRFDPEARVRIVWSTRPYHGLAEHSATRPV